MIELRDATLDHFDTWRDKVIQRLGEAINQHQDDGSGTTTRKPQDRSRGDELRKELEDTESDHALHQLYPPQETPLRKLPQAQRVLILHSLLLLLLSQQDLHCRVSCPSASYHRFLESPHEAPGGG